MRFTTQRQALDYLRDRRAPSQVVKAFGDLIDDAEAMYATQAGGLFEGAPGAMLTNVAPPPVYTNNNTSFLAPFVIANTSTQILPQNIHRTLLLVQNLSAASSLYIALGGGASSTNGILLSPGLGIVFDNVCPNDSLNAYFDNAGPQPGIALEMRASS